MYVIPYDQFPHTAIATRCNNNLLQTCSANENIFAFIEEQTISMEIAEEFPINFLPLKDALVMHDVTML